MKDSRSGHSSSFARDTLAKLQLFGCKEEKEPVSSLVVAYRNDFFVCFVSLFFFRFNVM